MRARVADGAKASAMCSVDWLSSGLHVVNLPLGAASDPVRIDVSKPGATRGRPRTARGVHVSPTAGRARREAGWAVSAGSRRDYRVKPGGRGAGVAAHAHLAKRQQPI